MNGLLQVFDPANIGAVLAQFQTDLQKPTFWLAVGKIIWINVLLSGDNALVIAMACRGLPRRQRLWGMAIGAGIAVVLLITFTGIVATLMGLPYLKLVGGLALIVIATRLLVPDDEGDDVTAGTSLWQAVRIVVIADIIMSLDNVIAVAAAANGQLPLLILGLAISIPDDHRRRRADHDGAGPASDSGLARRDIAGVDRGWRDRDRSGRSSASCNGCSTARSPSSSTRPRRCSACRRASCGTEILPNTSARCWVRSPYWRRDRSGGSAGCAIPNVPRGRTRPRRPGRSSGDSRADRRLVTLQLLTIDPERPTSRASCLKRLPTRSATRSTILCSNTSISLRPRLRKWIAGNTPGRAADIRWATRKAAPRTRARSTIAGGTSSRISAGGSFSSLRPA